MKSMKYFAWSGLIVILLSISATAIAQAVDPEPTLTAKEKIFGFVKDIDGLNILLMILSTFFGGMWWLVRSKLKQIGELFIKVYEYTDEKSDGRKKLTHDERNDIVSRVLSIFSKTSTVSIDKSRLLNDGPK